MTNIQQLSLSLEVQNIVGDELFSWMIIICDLKIVSLLLSLLSSIIIKSIVIILIPNISVLDEFWRVQELGFMRASCS